MEVKLKAGDSLNIPKGCKAVIKDNVVVFEKEEKEEVEFKDGDVVVGNGKYGKFPFIFKGNDNDGFHKFYACLGHYGNLIICKEDIGRCGNSKLSLATEEEKQLLFDKMKEHGLRWNDEEKRVENIRWRASLNERYYYVSKLLDYYSEKEEFYLFDEEMWRVGNYFRTEKQAKEAAKRVKEVLRKYHEELGE